ncbi:hypothetical protein UFOVP381_9 [uncultured Caudovirales phage]|uniref:Uncharacterized protein n=1 Tax=uncultured Caudovirales phage TaxID=2100421 RepID=A0A6J7X260_9CAUD|nr:hypothetical protein UFOVP381_9 [uncultured Caudovirales phage]
MNTTQREVRLDDLLSDPFRRNDALGGGVRAEDDGRFQHDTKLHVRFYSRPMMNAAKSREAGRPIHEQIDFVEIMVPGDKHSVIERKARELDKRRFSRQWAAYSAGKEDQQAGTPLSSLPFMLPAKAEEYKFFHITTAEQLAGASDGSSAAQAIMGFNGDKQKAAAYLQMAAGNAPILQMQQALEDKENQITAMQEQMNQMNQRIAELATKPTKKAVTAE